MGARMPRRVCARSRAFRWRGLVVTHVAVSEWERGRRPVPRRRLPGLATFLVVDAAYLRELWDADADERDRAALARRP